MAENHRPDLIIMDIRLPEMSGLEAAHRINSNENIKHIPIIAVTAVAMKGDEERMRKGGCDAYLAKPISITRLMETVNKLST